VRPTLPSPTRTTLAGVAAAAGGELRLRSKLCGGDPCVGSSLKEARSLVLREGGERLPAASRTRFASTWKNKEKERKKTRPMEE